MSPRPRRTFLGAFSGLIWGFGTAVLISMYGVRPLDPALVFGVPAAAAALSAVWSRRSGRAATAALVLLAVPPLQLSARVSAQAACEVWVDGQYLPGSSVSDPVVVDEDTDPIAVEITIPDDASDAAAWVKIGGIEIEILSAAAQGGGYREFDRSALTWFDAPGLYEVGGSVAGHCSDSGYVRILGNPLAHPLGQGAAAAVALGLFGTMLAGRTPSDGRHEIGTPRGRAELPPGDRQTSEGQERHNDTGLDDDVRDDPIRSGAATTAVPRQMEATLVDPATGQAVTGFAAGAAHHIEVRLGAVTSAPAAAPAPAAAEPVQIHLVLTEPNLLQAPEVAMVELAGSGASSLATFTLRTGPETTDVDARLIALHDNRILHTARLPRAVSARPQPAADRVNVAELETVADTVRPPRARQRRMDVALLVNHSAAHIPRVTAMSDAEAAVLQVAEGSIAAAVAGIDRELGQIVSAPGDFEALDSPGSVEVLVVLANHGRLLRSHIVDDFLDDRLTAAQAIQVVSATPDAYFPLELAYDFPAPLETAGLCPRASDVLAGTDPMAPCDGEHDETVVCPLGFWGLSRVIERHAHQKGEEVTGRFVLQSSPMIGRDVLTPGDVLFAASDRVDGFAPGTIAEVADTLSRLSYGHATQAKKWDEWISDVALRPALMVLLPHTVYSDTLRLPGLEIGTADRRWSSHIDQRFVPPEDRPVIAMLLGCETAVAGDVGYEAFPGAFRRAGVEVVIGTLTEILGRHAAPLATSLAEQIFDAWRTEPTPFGESMVGVRRKALSDGLIAALAVVAFGDADWLLGRAPANSSASGHGGA